MRRMRRVQGLGLDALSMDMVGDPQAATTEGTTIVRVGTAIFGPRRAAGDAGRRAVVESGPPGRALGLCRAAGSPGQGRRLRRNKRLDGAHVDRDANEIEVVQTLQIDPELRRHAESLPNPHRAGRGSPPDALRDESDR